MEPIGAISSQKTNETDLRSIKTDMPQSREMATRTETSGPDQAKIESIADDLDNYLKTLRHDLKISVDKQTGRTIVKVVSKDDGKTIRQIPSEDMLKLVSKMDEMTGVIFDEKN